ncbi:MAG: glutamine--tRNA ligase/YqeY domain fusion protein, partial [Acidobacteriota bacterium]
GRGWVDVDDAARPAPHRFSSPRQEAMTDKPRPPERRDFVREIVADDIESGRVDEIVTRFPPEPNGYLHVGHAKAICLDFGLAEETGGRCNLRFDDTNPETEDVKYVEAIERDVRWLGFEWDAELYASDYFEQLYDWAVELIRKGKAYVDELSEAEIRELRGTITEPGRESPFRDRPVEESLELFERMRAGEFPDGSYVLRAKIDMGHPNMKMRDPLMYRIRHATHYRRGDAWCIYPFYDWAHGQSDAIEGITHSLCTLEFENNRELYDWYLEALEIDPRPHQYEFARLNLDYTVMSKRRLLRLVNEGHVSGWDDPRMPTLAGMRRRGYTPEAIRAFCDMVGVAKADNRVDISMLEYAVRDDLNHRAPRVMAVTDPLKVVLTDWPEGEVDELDCPHWPHDVPREGSRKVPLSRELYIERDDFMEAPPPEFHRLAPGREVRLRYGYVIRCDEVVEDDDGEVVELRCSHDPDSRGGTAPDGRKVRGTIHWVSAPHALEAEVRLYDRLFRVPDPDARDGELAEYLNPESLVTVSDARLEPSLADAAPGERYQFERLGYFVVDEETSADRLVFNRTVELRDTWKKRIQKGVGLAHEVDARVIRGGEDENEAPEEEPEEVVVGTRSEERDRARAQDPELAARFDRYREELGLSEQDADILSGDRAVAELFEAALEAHPDNPEGIANWIVHEVRRELEDRNVEELGFGGEQLGELVMLIDRGTISTNIAREVLTEMIERGGEPAAIVERRGLEQVGDPERLTPVVEGILESHPDKVREYRGGKTGLLGFFMGQVMRHTDGKADPEVAREILLQRLSP